MIDVGTNAPIPLAKLKLISLFYLTTIVFSVGTGFVKCCWWTWKAVQPKMYSRLYWPYLPKFKCMCPVILEIVHLEIHPIDKPEYIFNGASCRIVCNREKKVKICYNNGIECYARVKMNEVYSMYWHERQS